MVPLCPIPDEHERAAIAIVDAIPDHSAEVLKRWPSWRFESRREMSGEPITTRQFIHAHWIAGFVPRGLRVEVPLRATLHECADARETLMRQALFNDEMRKAKAKR
jgi:hypothetical protein